MRYVWRFVSAVLMVALVCAAAGGTAWAQADAVGERVYVLGAVNNPGDFEFKPGMGAKEAFDLAGGLAPNADPAGAMLLRASGDKVPLKVEAILEGKETVPLAAGDTIVVKPGTIRVEGQVKNPGMLDLRAGMTAKHALALAGGPTETAAPAAAYITRSQKTIPVNLAGPESKIALEAGDVLTVPELTASITGEVGKPGTYTLVSGKTDTLDGLLEKAGGATAKGDLKKVRISSVQGAERPTTTIDASEKVVRQATRIEKGDAVFVPEAKVEHRHRASLNEVYQLTIIIYTLVQIFNR